MTSAATRFFMKIFLVDSSPSQPLRLRTAIAGKRAAELHELESLARDLQNRSDDQTRFLLVERPGQRRPRHDGAHPPYQMPGINRNLVFPMYSA